MDPTQDSEELMEEARVLGINLAHDELRRVALASMRSYCESSEIGKLAEAMALASAEMGNAKKDGENPHFLSKFASLESVVNAYQPVFAKHGLSLLQFPLGDVLVNLLLHKSGQWIRSSYEVHASKTDPQGIGSAITYARRYSAMAIAGIAPEDDDGERAMGRGATSKRTNGKPASPTNGSAPATGKEKMAFLKQVELKRGEPNSSLTSRQVVQAIVADMFGKDREITKADLQTMAEVVIINGEYDLDTAQRPEAQPSPATTR